MERPTGDVEETIPVSNEPDQRLRCLPQRRKPVWRQECSGYVLLRRRLSVSALLLPRPRSQAGRPGAGQPATPAVPPASGTLSSDLNRSGGVIIPPAGIDPEIKQTPPATGSTMPIIPPPGTPGGNPGVKPK